MYIIGRNSLKGDRQLLTPKGFIGETLIGKFNLKVITYDLNTGYDVITKLQEACISLEMKKTYRLIAIFND
jgi:hypothetical protein